MTTASDSTGGATQKRPYRPGTFVVEIDVPDGHGIGHGQLLARVSEALNGEAMGLDRLPFMKVRSAFRPADNGGEHV